MATLIGRLKDLLVTQKQKALTDYQSLVEAAADGQAIPPADAKVILTEAGRKVEDLETDVAAVQRRRDLQNQLTAARRAQQDLDTIKGKIRAATQERDRLLEDWDRKHLNPLIERLRTIEPLAAEAGRVETQLRQLGNPQDEELAATGKALLAATERRAQFHEAFLAAQQDVRTRKERVQRSDHRLAREYEQQKLVQEEGRVTLWLSRRDQVDREIDELQSKRRQLEKVVLE